MSPSSPRLANSPLIKLISAQETFNLRQAVLRPGLPIEESHFECDLFPETFHLGSFVKDRLCGIATFFPEKCPQQKATFPYRLRGMAVNPLVHRKGIGRLLIREGEKLLREHKSDLLWFNARQSAFEFYENMSYLYASEIFEIPGVGPHKVMFKKLT